MATARLLRAGLPVAVALSLGAAAGCGGDSSAPSSVAQQPASAPAATSTDVPTTTTPLGVAGPEIQRTTTPASTTPTATTGVPPGGGENQPGGAGDEEPIRTPAAFTVGADGFRPERITVAAFLAIDLSLTAEGGARHVVLDAPGGGTIDVADGATAHRHLTGLKPGDYPLVGEGGARAVLHVVSGGAPGP